MNINNYDTMPESRQVELVSRSGWVLEHIASPSETVCTAAVNCDGNAVRYIKNPLLAVMVAAVMQDGYAIQYIQNPSEVVCLAAVKQDGRAIQYITNPSEIVQIEAIKSHPNVIFSNIQKPYSNVVLATFLVHYPAFSSTPRDILDRAPSILEAHCPGLGDIYTIGLSMAMTGDELSKTMIEWIESHSSIGVAVGAEMSP